MEIFDLKKNIFWHFGVPSNQGQTFSYGKLQWNLSLMHVLIYKVMRHWAIHDVIGRVRDIQKRNADTSSVTR